MAGAGSASCGAGAALRGGSGARDAAAARGGTELRGGSEVRGGSDVRGGRSARGVTGGRGVAAARGGRVEGSGGRLVEPATGVRARNCLSTRSFNTQIPCTRRTPRTFRPASLPSIGRSPGACSFVWLRPGLRDPWISDAGRKMPVRTLIVNPHCCAAFHRVLTARSGTLPPWKRQAGATIRQYLPKSFPIR